MPLVKKTKGKKSLKGRKMGRQRLKMKDWLRKCLDEGVSPSLRWRSKAKGTFEISWKHASGRTWVEESDTEIFKQYAIHTGKHKEGSAADTKKWKANFRCALNSLNDVKELSEESNKKGENACKVYTFLEESEIKIKSENDCDGDIKIPSDSNMECDTDTDTQDDTVAPVIKMEAPSPASEDMSQPASPINDAEIDHCYSKNDLANIPNLPSFKSSVSYSGGVVECRLAAPVVNPSERIDYLFTKNYYNNIKSEDGLNSEGEDVPMNDDDLVQMMDGFSSDYGSGRRDSESSNASSASSPYILSAAWDDLALSGFSLRNGIQPVVVKDQPLTSANPDWKLTSLK